MKFLCILLLPLALLANSPEQNSQLFGAFTLLPPFIAIVLAFVTKDVILSLFLGAMSGTFMLALVSNGYGASELIGAQNAAQALAADTLNNAMQNLSTTQALESAGKTNAQIQGDTNALALLYHSAVGAFTGFISRVLHSMASTGNAGVILQVLTIGGVVALITKNGGTKAVALWLSHKAKQAKSSQFATWLMGVFVFF